VSFHTFSLPEDRCVRLLFKNLGRHMPEDVVREELENLGICVQRVLQVRWGRRDQEAAKDRPLNPHFIASLARGPDVVKVRSLTKLSGLRVTVETYVAPKGPLQCKRCQRFGHTQRTAATHPGILLVVRLTFQGSAVPHNRSLSAAVVEETTQPTTGAARNGRRPWRRLQRGRL